VAPADFQSPPAWRQIGATLVNNGHLLWSAAFLLMTVLALLIAYSWSILVAVAFWVVAILILIALRPD
jgi:hypothetical protein